VQYKICTFVETSQDMENQLKSANILNAYKSFKKDRESLCAFSRGQFLGYLEAGLQSFGYLETSYDKDDNGETHKVVKKEIIRNTSWWKKDKVETQEQAIIRQVEKMFIDMNINFKG
jgi:hypothetical protein